MFSVLILGRALWTSCLRLLRYLPIAGGDSHTPREVVSEDKRHLPSEEKKKNQSLKKNSSEFKGQTLKHAHRRMERGLCLTWLFKKKCLLHFICTRTCVCEQPHTGRSPISSRVRCERREPVMASGWCCSKTYKAFALCKTKALGTVVCLS